MNARHTAVRAACLLASVAITTLVVGSQLGIAHGYSEQANALIAAQRSQPMAQKVPAAAAPRT